MLYDIVEEVFLHDIIFYMKGVNIMKKYLSLAAAAVIAANTSSLFVSAAYEELPRTRIWDEEIEMFDAMDKGELIVDVDDNGVFDLNDCILLYGFAYDYDMGDEFTDRINSICDYNGNGCIDRDEAVNLLRYYLLDHPATFEELSADAYSEYDQYYAEKLPQYYCHGGNIIDHYLAREFAEAVRDHSEYLKSSYNLFVNMAENGVIDPDFNADGNVDLADLDFYWLYGMNDYIYVYGSEDFDLPEVPDDIAKRCSEFYDICSCSAVSSWTNDYLTMYCFEKGNVTPDMINDEYFESVAEGSSQMLITRILTNTYYELFPSEDKMAFNGALFSREYEAYRETVKDDIALIPDSNLDGVLDSTDAFNIEIYIDDIRKGRQASDSILSRDIWNVFDRCCDLNGNGISGDMNDLTILDLIMTEFMSIDELEAYFDRYVERLNAYVAELAEAKGVPAYKLRPSGSSSPLVFSTDAERTGDTNSDGQTDLADAIRIMQALANPNKYQLSTSERFNGDIDNTGDGITLEDACAIQNMLLGL